MRKSETFVDGHDVGDTIAGVEHDTSGSTGGIEREYGLNRDVEGGCVEGLEDDLGHLLSVRLGVDRSFGEQDRVLLGSHSQLVVESMMPDLLHVIPVGDNTVLDRVAEGEDTTLRLCLITDIGVFLTHTDHDTVMTWPTDNGGCLCVSGCLEFQTYKGTYGRLLEAHRHRRSQLCTYQSCTIHC